MFFILHLIGYNLIALVCVLHPIGYKIKGRLFTLHNAKHIEKIAKKKTAAHCAGIILRIAAVFSHHFIVQLSMLLILFVERFLFHYGASTFYYVGQAPYSTRYNHPHFTFHCSPFLLRTGTRSTVKNIR